MKDSLFIDICQNEYQALIKMLKEAINLCSDELWTKKIDEPPFWQQVYHAVYYLDFYLGSGPKKHIQRFELKENLNERYEQYLTKEEILNYLEDVSTKSKKFLEKITSKELEEDENKYFWTGPTIAHRIIYNIRHSQHHIGRLNSILRRHMNDTSKWIITPK